MALEMAVSQRSPAVVIALRRTLDLTFPPTVLRSPTCSRFVPNLRGPGRVLCSSLLEKRVFLTLLETNPDLLLHRSLHAAAFGELVELSRHNKIHRFPISPHHHHHHPGCILAVFTRAASYPTLHYTLFICFQR